MMKGIDKKKHEHILQCLEELRALTKDTDERNRIEQEITVLSGIYGWYNTFMEGIQKESERYHSRYTEVQCRIYKELRSARRRQKK